MKKLILVSLLLASCATPTPTEYGPSKGGGLGYVDREIAPKRYEIQFRANSVTSSYTMERYFHRRATELCHGDNYDSAIKHEKEMQIHDGQLTGYAFIPTTKSALPFVTGEVTCR